MRMRIAVLVLAVAALAPRLSAQIVRGSQLGAGQRAHLAALGAEAAGLRIDVVRGGGVARTVAGSLSLRGATLQERCDDLIGRHGALFGASAGMEFGTPVVLREQSPGQPRQVRVQQYAQGFPLPGYGLWLRFDETGRLACVHGALSAAAAQVPAPVVSAQAGELIALQHLQGLGHVAADFRSGPRTETLGRLVNGDLALVHETHVVLRDGLRPLVVVVDAASGAVVQVRENRASGTGTFHFGGQPLGFLTGGGKGTVYKSVKSALLSKPAGVALPEVARQDVVAGLAEDGFLFGRFAGIIDFADFIFSNPAHDWSVLTDDDFALDNPVAPGQLFDHDNTYYWITRMGHFMEGPFGAPLGTDYSIPVVVNVGGLVNAFYSSDDLGLDEGPGFFAFGDVGSQTASSMDDFSRDPTIVCHEYTHAVVDKAGLAFGDNDVDTPPRAVNEAIADFFSAAMNKSSCIGPVFARYLGPDLGLFDDCLRDLAAERVFPEDLFFATGDTGLPEEHEAGVIFGATLWRFSSALKKAGPGAVADAMLDWPQSTAEVGFPTVTPGNAEDACAAYMGACAAALVDSVASGPGAGSPARKAGKVLGAVMANGLLGSVEHDTVYQTDTLSKGVIDLASAFVGGHAEHVIVLPMLAGASVSIRVKGLLGTQVGFALDEADGALDFTQPAQAKAAGTLASQSGIEVVIGGAFVLHVTNPGGLGGAYKVRIVVK